MVTIILEKSPHLTGEVAAPPSKAYTHRMLIAASLSNGISKLVTPLVSDDTNATLRAMEAFGAKVNVDSPNDLWRVSGVTSFKKPTKPIYCGESGTTVRFMVPIATLAPGPSVFTLGHSLRHRPMTPLLNSLKELGAETTLHLKDERPSINVKGGGLQGGKTSIRGDISSQFVSGLLFACPLGNQTSQIAVTTPLESSGYVNMTLEVLAKHRIKTSNSDDLTHFVIPPHQEYRPYDHEVPGDFSSAAFLLAGAAITSSTITVTNIDRDTAQGDKAILDILAQMGSNIKIIGDVVKAEGGELTAVDVDSRAIPDLIPVFTALACYAKGVTKLYNAKRLRYKESDRLNSLYIELKKMGAKIMVKHDTLTVEGPCAMHGATVNPHNDHRIAMACAIVALGAKGKTQIQNSECINKSYPRFFRDLRALGAKCRWEPIR